jgi:FkbH-like protein
MLDHPAAAPFLLPELRQGLSEKPLTLPAIFEAGERIAAADPAPDPTVTKIQRIAVIGAVTIEYLRRAVACAAVLEGVFPVLYQAPYGAYVQEVLDPGSALHQFAPELVVIAPHWRDMVVPLPIGAGTAEVEAALDARVYMWRGLWARLVARGARIIQHMLVPPANAWCGVAERRAPAAPGNQIRRLNDKLLEAGGGQVHWLDLPALAAGIGLGRFAPAKFYHAAKLDFDPRWLPDYLPVLRAAWRAAHARAKKVLVLDLDNTLWGGVIGDDGVEGIALGAESAAGEAFADWQAYLKALAERGVILAVCSKNAPEIAASGFTHPHTVLACSDFAAFECSWNDKAGGLRRIAQALNLGTDSFVFADDNPAECDLVRQTLPEVAVVHLGSDPASFIATFDAGHWFDMQSFTAEDLGRAASYAARAEALAGQAQATDLGGYLAGLAMRGRLYRPEEADITRVAQLEQKTNQFNTTTRRYSETAIRALLARDDAIVLAFRLADRFGDHGLVSTLIALHEGDALRIDSWLMSCRVFARSAEAFILRGLVAMARERGAARLLGEYRPTPKNAVVAGLFPSLGFAASASGEGIFMREVAAGVEDLVTHIG